MIKKLNYPSLAVEHQRAPAQLVESTRILSIIMGIVTLTGSTFRTHFVGSHLGIFETGGKIFHFRIVMVVNFPSATEFAAVVSSANLV